MNENLTLCHLTDGTNDVSEKERKLNSVSNRIKRKLRAKEETTHYMSVKQEISSSTYCTETHMLVCTGGSSQPMRPVFWARDMIVGSLCTVEVVAVFVCGGQSLWTSRNNRAPQAELLALAKHVAKMVEELKCLAVKVESCTSRSKDKWRPPSEAPGEINSDGAFVARTGYSSGATNL